jgi:hypothetical protein
LTRAGLVVQFGAMRRTLVSPPGATARAMWSVCLAASLALATAAAPSAAAAQAAATRLTVRDVLERSGLRWRTRETPHFRLHFQPGSQAERDIDELAADIERARAHDLALLGERDHPRIDVFYLTTRDQMARFIGARPKALAAPSANYALFVYNRDVRPYHRHEVMHILATRLWGQPAPPADWIGEGLAVFAEGMCLQYPIARVARSMIDGTRRIAVETLIRSFRTEDDLDAYVQAGAFVEYIYRTFGREAVRAIWRRGPDAFVDVTGKLPGILQEDWRRALARDPRARGRVDQRRLRAEGCG